MQVNHAHKAQCEGERAGAHRDEESDVQSRGRVAGFACVHTEPSGWCVTRDA